MILVCGGAGYIGSHMVATLHDAGYEIVVFDNLSTGHEECVKHGKLEIVDLLDFDALQKLFARYEFGCVYHFAARSLVAESVTDPALYFRNNVQGTLNLLQVMREVECNKIIFSSTASVYGEPETVPVPETHQTRPINPYGHSKRMVEVILGEYARAHGISSVCLRYFNAAGAWPERGLGEWHEPESHLIPNVIRALHGKLSAGLHIYGNDYPTPDGSCVRDYIHVRDLCHAHLAAAQYLSEHSGAHVFNLGTGQGHSVMEVLRSAEEVSGMPVPYTLAPRRAGDPAVLVADATLARQILRWAPIYGLTEMVKSAWEWERMRG